MYENILKIKQKMKNYNYLFLFQIIMVYSFVGLKTPTYGNYEYPWWALLIGWVIALASILPLPIAAVHSILQQKGSLLQVQFTVTLEYFKYRNVV